jgi:hypothetical protein
MEIKIYEDYDIAELSTDDLKNITECEKVLSSKTQEDIVLIAYKNKHSGAGENQSLFI